jgi:hypothetical protein
VRLLDLRFLPPMDEKSNDGNGSSVMVIVFENVQLPD